MGFTVYGKGYTYIDYDGKVKVNPAKIVDYPVPPKLFKVALELVDEVEEGNVFRVVARRNGHDLIKRLAKQAVANRAKLAHCHRLRHWFENACRPLVKDVFELADVMRHEKRSPQIQVGQTGTYARALVVAQEGEGSVRVYLSSASRAYQRRGIFPRALQENWWRGSWRFPTPSCLGRMRH